MRMEGRQWQELGVQWGLFLVGGKSVKNKERGNRVGQRKPLDGDSDLTP